MQLNHLKIENFRLFAQAEFSFNPRFNLVIGENGHGKTSLLRAVAVALGGWAYAYVRTKNNENRRPIQPAEVRVFHRDKRAVRSKKVNIDAFFCADVIDKFDQMKPASNVLLMRQCDELARSTGIDARVVYASERSNINPGKGAEYFDKNKYALPSGFSFHLIEQGAKVVKRVESGHDVTLPVIAFYECDRLWHAAAELKLEETVKTAPERFDPYKDCFHSSADHRAIAQWLIRHQLASLQQGKDTTALQMLQKAARGAIDGCSGLRFDIEDSQVYVDFPAGEAILFEHLSDGQRTLLGLFCDIARRISILNPHFGDRALDETPGVVLIDELDLHLHPKWQRRIIQSLRQTFPKVQFICTTHSPQLIGQARPDEIIQLDASRTTAHPGQSLGMDSNWILRHIMGSDDRDPDVAKALDELFEHIEQARFDEAQAALVALRQRIGEHPELVEADALIGRYTRHDGE